MGRERISSPDNADISELGGLFSWQNKHPVNNTGR